MSTSSLHAPDPKPKKKRLSLHLNRPSFRKSITEGPEADADEIARVRKAAAWQWYTRGVADVVVPTKRVPAAAAAGNNGLNATVQYRAKSRFNAEASARNRPSLATAPSPLYDEFELSALKSHMAGFVQRLQKQQEEDASAAANSGITPATKDEIKLNHKPPSGAKFPISSFQRPLSAIHKFFRKISGAIKSSGSTISPPVSANHGPVAPADDEMQYHYHQYIHHHHHHYHYGCSPEESPDMMINRRRRHSESSDSRHTLGLCREAAVDEEDPIKASPRRRRHSERFSTHPMRGSIDHEEVIGGPAGNSPALPRRHNSERFSTHNKMQGGQLVEQHGVVVDDDDDDDEFITAPRRIRRHSFRSYKLDCSTPFYHEAAAYCKLAPSPTPDRRRHSERFDPSYRTSNCELSPNKAPRSPMLRQPPTRRHFESLSERQFSIPPTVKANPGGHG